ncbi:MAG: RloB family protein [Bacteroidales bacterium]|jgi:hypothetical protein|nr:RloB family protein [Bacteroidales bacterium]MEE1220246.1 RloB family protein [Bacteroidales bacterium]MEE1322439.1 RloB family protein [Bacteroidales bacterium]
MNGKLKNTTLILGEGITEWYYIKSLQDVFKGLNFEPGYPKQTNLQELGMKIEEGIKNRYDRIFCLIDMDNKTEGKGKTEYNNFKKKYLNNKKCEIDFFETHRCTELFFLYYFQYTSRPYDNQPSLIKDLNKKVPYEKKEEFFKKCKGLHNYFEKNGGSLEDAISNANKSIKEKLRDNRDYTYSDLGKLIEKLEKR